MAIISRVGDDKPLIERTMGGYASLTPVTGTLSIPDTTDNGVTAIFADTASQFRTAFEARVGALGGGTGTVTKVNGKDPVSGVVTLVATDIGAMPSSYSGSQLAPVYVLGANGATVPSGLPVGTVIMEPPVGSTPTLLGTSTGSATGATSLTITRATNAGARLILFLNLASATSVTDSASNTWTLRETTVTSGAPGNRIMEVWECIGASAISSVTVAKASSAQAVLCELQGGTGASVHAQAYTTGTTTGSIPLTVSANALIIGAVSIAINTGNTATISAPFTDLVSEAVLNSSEMKLASYTATAGGSYGPAWTLATGASKSVIDIAVNP